MNISKIKQNIISNNLNNINIWFSKSNSSKNNNSNNKNSFDSQKKLNKKINPINLKYEERLHHKKIAFQEITEKKIQKVKKNLLDSQLNQCIFKPKILKVRIISAEKTNRNNILKDYKNYFQKSLTD